MSKNSFKSIKNGIIISVISGIIISVIPPLREYFVEFFSWFWSGIVWCWESLIASYSLPGWVWLIVFIFALVGLISIFLAVRGKLREPAFKSYVEDFIRGAKWRWKWYGNEISDLRCYCPSCDAELICDDGDFDPHVPDPDPRTDFICENCKRIITSTKSGDKYYVIGAVKREIDLRIRSNKYKK